MPVKVCMHGICTLSVEQCSTGSTIEMYSETHLNIAQTHSLLCSDQPTGRLALVFELMDMNIYELIRGRSHYVAEDRIRRYMYQLIKAMDHMHKAGIFHRSALLFLLERCAMSSILASLSNMSTQVNQPRQECFQLTCQHG